MKKQIALAIAMVLVVAAAIVWVRVERAGTDDVGHMTTDTTVMVVGGQEPSAEERSVEVPYDLQHWIEGTLWRNGLLGTHRDSFLTKSEQGGARLRLDASGSKPAWTVDFSGLDVSVLGEDTSSYGSRGMSDDFTGRILVDGTRLCRAEDRKVGFPGWTISGMQRLRCGPQERRNLVRSWFRDRFGREPGASEVSEEEGELLLDVSCRSKDNVGGLGRLRSVDFRRIRLTGCTLASDEVLQLADVTVDRLELVDAKADVLPLFGARIAERLSIQGGDVRWVDVPLVCPHGRSSCEYMDKVLPGKLSVEIRGVAFCSPSERAKLKRLGATLEDMRCQDIPVEMIERMSILEAQWNRLKEEEASKLEERSYDTISLEDRPRFADLKKTWELAVETTSVNECGEDSYPKGYSVDLTRGGNGRVEDSYFEGEGIQIGFKGRKIRAGISRDELISLLGRPSVDREGFLAWTVTGTCDGQSANLVAHLDAQGKLDAWIDRVQPECGGC